MSRVGMYDWAKTACDLFSEEEAAEAKQRRKARLLQEDSLKWTRQRLERVRKCQSIPEAERMRRGSGNLLPWSCGYIYLAEKRGPIFKIGATHQWKKRRDKLLREGFVLKEKYATVVHFELETALHDHFDHFRIRRKDRQKGQRKNIKGERFCLPEEEVDRFKETVANVERCVLVATEARLELEIMKMEGDLARMQLD